MTKLKTLRRQLATLRGKRRWMRWATAASALVTAVVVTLAVLFLLDVVFELSVAQRIVVMLLGAAALAWAAFRYVIPWLGVRETEIDMALVVEQQQEINSDLVAALQFETPEATTWGSPQLEGAVIDYVAEMGRGLDVFAGLSTDRMRRRLAIAGVALVAVVIAVALLPGHSRVFLNRLLLGSSHYPTRTDIQYLAINGRALDPTPFKTQTVKSPFGREVAFEVHCAGETPEQGQVELRSASNGNATTIELVRTNRAAGEKAVYTGSLPRLLDSVSYQLYVGDAWTDAANIDLIPLPVVEARLRPIAPSYTRAAGQQDDTLPGSLQLSVIEGSQVQIEVHETNKPLREVLLTAQAEPEPLQFALQPTAADRRVWKLPTANTPFSRVERPVRFEIQVTDEDDLHLESPLRGFVRLKADRAPRATADFVHKVVLPTAQPVVEYRATDDYGISKLVMHVDVSRRDGQTQQREVPLDDSDAPVLGERLPLVGKQAINLAQWNLEKGDQLKCTLEVVDYRGPSPGTSSLSEPLVLEISDESGVLAAIAAADEHSEQRLSAIIKRQLGIGESP